MTGPGGRRTEAVGRRRRAAFGAAAFLLGLGPATTTPAAAQAPGSGAVRVAVVTSPDTVRIGEPFVVAILAESPDSVAFPPLLDAGDAWEQLRLVRVDASRPGQQRAYYELVAWETGALQLPPVTLSVGRERRRHSVRLTGPYVRATIPASVEQPGLRAPRAPRSPSSPWGTILLALLMALLAAWWWWNRHRAVDEAVVAESDPGAAARALEALGALRGQAEAGSIPAPRFYDRLEAILREYLVETRAWPASHPVREAREAAVGAMHELHRRAVLARFAAVGASRDELVEDADTSYSWVLEDAA